MNQQPRLTALLSTALAALVLASALMAAAWLGDAPQQMHFDARLAPPGSNYWFGTDALGRDMAARTLAGLTLSFWVGSSAALLGTLIALSMALLAMLGPRWDALVSLAIDTLLSVPHLLLLLMIAFALGGGTQAVIIAVALSHWPSLARVLRAELLHIRHAPYVQISQALGKPRRFIVRHHWIPQVLPHCLVGALLLFPHAVLHEAALSFLGVGLSADQPAIGVLLGESMRHVSGGDWWLGVFPGAGLLLMVLCIQRLGETLRRAWST
ncbi:ABC transporter permease [Vreelandella arcis]|uniref:Peptide/nickel transport system permease protein n=1 Tax=Vreelandella arcis TaxID=416873 RepID=A0A1H0CL38_9GAMM|nr:ABC transporter permease [Halomonas arcis]SDN58589.1 peptide/nickel transport system permease protein [Halomonas arcis]